MQHFTHSGQYMFLFLLIHLSRISKFSGVGIGLFWIFLAENMGEVLSGFARSRAVKFIFRCLKSSRMV